MKKRPSRRGFTTVGAIFMIPIIALTIMALSSFFISESRRSKQMVVDTQLRSMLAAGLAVVVNRKADFDGPTEVALPAGLAVEGQLRIRPVEAETKNALYLRIDATYRSRSMHQILIFSRTADGLQLKETRLNG